MSVIRKLYSRVVNNCLLIYPLFNEKLHDGQGGFEIGRSLIDNILPFNELIQCHIKECKLTCPIFFLHVNKGYDMLWREWLWCKMWGMGIKGKM